MPWLFLCEGSERKNRGGADCSSIQRETEAGIYSNIYFKYGESFSPVSFTVTKFKLVSKNWANGHCKLKTSLAFLYLTLSSGQFNQPLAI